MTTVLLPPRPMSAHTAHVAPSSPTSTPSSPPSPLVSTPAAVTPAAVTPASVQLHAHPSLDALVASVTAQLHAACARALRHRGHALLSLAGGRTPFPIYRALAAATDLDWDDIVLLPGDERCVAHDHPACNLAGLREAFADAQGVRIASLTTADGDPAASLAHARTTLRLHADVFDAVVLGLGEDGHTASLFPGAAALARAMAPAPHDDGRREDVFLVHPDPLPPEAPFARISLGLARLLRARDVHLVVTGARKRAVLDRALAAADPLHLPVSAVLHAGPAHGRHVHVHWSP